MEIANRVEAAVHVWRQKERRKQSARCRKGRRPLWGGKVKSLVSEPEKNVVLARRAETLLHTLRRRFPGLPQTALDMNKIQYNRVRFNSLKYIYICRCIGWLSFRFFFFFVAGRWTVDSGELLEGDGELGVQHNGEDRRHSVRRRRHRSMLLGAGLCASLQQRRSRWSPDPEEDVSEPVLYPTHSVRLSSRHPDDVRFHATWRKPGKDTCGHDEEDAAGVHCGPEVGEAGLGRVREVVVLYWEPQFETYERGRSGARLKNMNHFFRPHYFQPKSQW